MLKNSESFASTTKSETIAMKNYTLLLIALTLSLFGITSATAQDAKTNAKRLETIIIRGVFFDEEKKPIADADVTARVCNDQIETTKTDADGGWIVSMIFIST